MADKDPEDEQGEGDPDQGKAAIRGDPDQGKAGQWTVSSLEKRGI